MAFSLIGRISPYPLLLLLLSCEVTKAGWLSLELRRYWIKPNAHFPPFPFRARSMKKIRNAKLCFKTQTCELKIQIKFYGYPFALRKFCFDFLKNGRLTLFLGRGWFKVVKSWLKVLRQSQYWCSQKVTFSSVADPVTCILQKVLWGNRAGPIVMSFQCLWAKHRLVNNKRIFSR